MTGTANVLRRRMGLEPVAVGWTALALMVLQRMLDRCLEAGWCRQPGAGT